MKIKLNMSKLVAVTLSIGFVILTAMNGAAQEQKDPFKKEQAGKTESTAQPQRSKNAPLVSVEMRMIEMSRLAADELFKEQGGLAKVFVINEKTLGAISEMVIKNKAKVVSQSKIITESGLNCKNKSSREVIYPVEYQQQAESIGTTSAGKESFVKVIVTPAAFETRDTGTIFDFTPTIRPDGKLIDIVCLPQRVRLSAYPNKIIVNSSTCKTEIEQPVFISEDVTTSLTIQNGTTVLVSVCDATSDQEKPEKAGENIILLIMTACVVPVN